MKLSLGPLAALSCVASLLGATGCNGSEPAAVPAAEADLTGTTVLLDCNVFLSGGGPDQQATVVRENGKLILKELTNHGSMEKRPMTEVEWEAKDITLRKDRFDGPEAKNRLWNENGDWLYEAKSDGFSVFGFADCWVDATKPR